MAAVANTKACAEKVAAEELATMESGHDGEIKDKAPAENKVVRRSHNVMRLSSS